MTRCICRHCGRPVQVSQSDPGKRELCPSCGAVLLVPVGEQHGGHARELPELTGSAKATPPTRRTLGTAGNLPSTSQRVQEDLDPASVENRLLDETDILPAAHYEPVAGEPVDSPRADRPRQAQLSPRTETKKTPPPRLDIVLRVAMVVVAVLAAVLCLFAIREIQRLL